MPYTNIIQSQLTRFLANQFPDFPIYDRKVKQNFTSPSFLLSCDQVQIVKGLRNRCRMTFTVSLTLFHPCVADVFEQMLPVLLCAGESKFQIHDIQAELLDTSAKFSMQISLSMLLQPSDTLPTMEYLQKEVSLAT